MCDKSQHAVLPPGYKYKPGQLVTINGRLYRIKKYLPNDTQLKCGSCCMKDCRKAMSKCMCSCVIEVRNGRFLISKKGMGRYLEFVSK